MYRIWAVATLTFTLLAWAGLAQANDGNTKPVRDDGAIASATYTSPPLKLSFSFNAHDGGYSFKLDVISISGEMVSMSFLTGEQVDFIVEQDCDEIWSWNYNRFFTQARMVRHIGSREIVNYTAEWSGMTNSDLPVESRHITVKAELKLEDKPITIQLPAMSLPLEKTTSPVESEGQISDAHERIGAYYKWDDIIPLDHWAYKTMEFLESKREQRYFPSDYFNGETQRSVADFRIGVYPPGDYEIRHSWDDDVSVVSYVLHSEMTRSFSILDADQVSPDKLAAHLQAISAYDDIPRSHWAYRAAIYLTDSDYLEGYPTLFFHGHRTLTSYEFTQVVLRLEHVMAEPWDENNKADRHVTELLLEALQYEFASQMAEISSS